MDLHETWNDKWPMTPKEGFKTTTDAQFEVGNNPNLDARLSEYANRVYLPKLIQAVDEAGIHSPALQRDLLTEGSGASWGLSLQFS